MATIYKNEIDSGYLVPSGKILHLGEQRGKLMVWTLWKDEPETQRFVILGTGQSPSECAVHLGTVQMENGVVWHVFAEPL